MKGNITSDHIAEGACRQMQRLVGAGVLPVSRNGRSMKGGPVGHGLKPHTLDRVPAEV